MLVFFFMCALLLASCDSYLRPPKEETALAKLGDKYLYKSDIPSYLYQNNTEEDATALVNDYINQWAAKQLLIQKAELNLPSEKIKSFDRLVANYKADLYTLAYKEVLVSSKTAASFSEQDLNSFYQAEKHNFRLSERLLRLRFVKLPLNFKDQQLIGEKLRNFQDDDIRYLDSISIQFNTLNLNDSIWVPINKVIREIPVLTNENIELYLKKSQFFKLQDSLGVYLGMVVDVLKINDTAPLSYIKPNLEQVLKIRKKQEFIKQIEIDIINEAIKNKSLEIFN